MTNEKQFITMDIPRKISHFSAGYGMISIPKQAIDVSGINEDILLTCKAEKGLIEIVIKPAKNKK